MSGLSWPRVIVNVKDTHLVFIHTEELLHWSVRTEAERERLIKHFQSALYVIAAAMNSGRLAADRLFQPSGSVLSQLHCVCVCVYALKLFLCVSVCPEIKWWGGGFSSSANARAFTCVLIRAYVCVDRLTTESGRWTERW